MRFDILTIFPDIFDNFKKEALIARAQKKKIISVNAHNLRDWTTDAHRTVDGRPYGGGAGMVMLVEPIQKAVRDLKNTKCARVIAFSAKGKTFNQAAARRLAKYQQIIMICGRYEGIDERVIRYIADEEISIGDYVLFGGEVPAMAVMEAVTRLLPGAIGKASSLQDESFNKRSGLDHKKPESLLEYPHFTRPESIKISGKTRTVPPVLLSGNHQRIKLWRKEQSRKLTRQRRPDLLP